MQRMDMHSRKQYLNALFDRYLKGDNKAKGRPLDEFCGNTGSSRRTIPMFADLPVVFDMILKRNWR